MEVYRCIRCGEAYDFATEKEGWRCYICGAMLAYHREAASPWGEHPGLKDYDMATT